jgi:pimeloyl-ACP methyl ester carboxylesterase
MPSSTMLEDFEAIEMQAEETRIFLRRFGSGPAVLLLHGFPQTHLMWRSSGAFAGSALHGRTPIG